MKNQLRKATLRAAALTMSATIAATSVPMTAFAQDTNEGNDGEQKKQESQKEADAEEKAVINQEANDTAPAVQAADDVVKEIVPAKEIKDDKTSVIDEKTGESKTVEEVANDAKEATKVAVTNEGKVADDIENLGTTANDIDSNERTISSNIATINNDLTKDNDAQKALNEEISKLQEEVDKAQYKEDVQEAYEKAADVAKTAEEAYNTSNTNYKNKVEELNGALAELEKQQKAYKDAVDAGIKDLGIIETNLKNAQDNVDALQAQVTAAGEDIAKKASVVLANNYFKETKTEADKKALIEDILNSYYLSKEVSSTATGAKVGNYVEGVGYEVTYTDGNNRNTIYISVEDNKADNGITIVHKNREDIEAHYTTEAGASLTLDYYDEMRRQGTAIEQDGEKYVFNKNSVVQATPAITAGVVGNTETKIEDVKTFVDENGVVKTTGKVTTITKTENALDIESKTEYKTKAAAEAGKAAVIAQYEALGYKNVSVEITSDSVEEKWEDTAVFFNKQIDNKEGVKTSKSYENGDVIDDRTKYIISDPSKKENYEHKRISAFGHTIYEWDEHVSNDWTIEYVPVYSTEKPCKTLPGLWGYVEEFFTGNNTPKTSVEKAVNDEIKTDDGYGFAVDYKVINKNAETATVYYVKGDKKTGTGNTKEAARADLITNCGDLDLNNADYNPKAKLVQNANVKYKITADKYETKVEKNVVLSYTTEKATKLTYVGETTNYNKVGAFNLAEDEAFQAQNKADDAVKDAYKDLNDQLTAAETALGTAEKERKSLEDNLKKLKNQASAIDTQIGVVKGQISAISYDPFGYNNDTQDKKNKIEEAFNKLPNRPSNNGGNNNGGGSSNNNNNNNNQPAAPVLPVGPAATTTTTTQQVVTLVDDQTPLSATADDTVAPKTNKKAAKKNATKTTDSDSKKANKNNTKKQPKKVTPEVEDDTIDEDLEIVSLDDNDQVPLAPGVASNDSTKDIMDETSSVSWLWLIILAVASVVTFGTYKGVKKHNENKGKNNR